MNLSILNSKRNKAFFSAGFALCFFAVALLWSKTLYGQSMASNRGREYIQIRVYHATDSSQLATISGYLQTALLPSLEKGNFKRTGCFAAIDNDTAKDKRLYVFIALPSLAQLESLTALIDKTQIDSTTTPVYTKAAYDAAPYNRIETILLRAFEGAPQVLASGLKGAVANRVYELRSYESATEALHQNKVKMFNSGEVDLFKRLGFNAVFYGQVIVGGNMPNLMYMTSFDNKAARDEHWKTFGSDPEWKTMSAKPEYQHNVSKNTIVFLRPMVYSKL